MLDNDLELLLSDELSSSQAFLTRVDDLDITSIFNLMENILDSDNGSQPDMCNLLCIFHADTDVMDPLTGTHDFREDIIIMFHFAFKMKKAWTSCASPDSFNYEEHFNHKKFKQSLKKEHRKNNLFFKCGLAAFYEENEGCRQEEEKLAQRIKESTQKMGNMSMDDTKPAETPSGPKDPAFAFVGTPGRSADESSPPEASKSSPEASGTGSPPSPDPASPDDHSASDRLRNPSTAYGKEPKFVARSPVDPKHVFNGDFSAWDETSNFLRAFALGRQMGYLIAPEFLEFYSTKLKEGSKLADIHHACRDDDGLSIRDHQCSLAQFKSDIKAVCSAILSVFRKNTDRAILTKHKATSDGISAWIDLHEKYDNQGAAAIAADEMEEIITKPCCKTFPGGVNAFLTHLTGAFSKLNELADLDETGECCSYSEPQMICRLTFLFSKDTETHSWAHLAKEVKDFHTLDEAVTYFRRKALGEDHHNVAENRQKSKERVMRRADLQPSPVDEAPSMMSIFMNTFEFQAYLQHSWPQELAHLKLSSELFNCIPPEARVQFSKNRRELANKLLEKASSNPVSTKGEKGESSAQTGRPWSRDTPPKKSFQPKNSALKTEIKAEQEESSGQEDDSDGDANDIQAAFNFLQTAYRDQHGFLGRLETTEHSTGQALNINGHSLVQVRSLMSDRQDHGLTCMDGCANAGVISTWTHHIDHTVPNRKANLLGAQSNFKSKGLSIGTGITTLLSPLDPNKPVCLLVHNEACIHDDPTSLYSNCQMREHGIVVDDVATKHVKDSQGNKGTQSIHIPNGGPKLPMAIADALPVMTIRKPTQEKLDTLPKHVLTSIEPWNPKEHHHDFEPVVLNAEISPENSENSDKDSSVPDLLTPDDDCSDSSSECSDLVEDLEDEGEQFQDAMEDVPTTEEPEVTATPSLDPSEKPANFHFFDPSDDLSDDAVKGKAVQLSIDDCSNHVRETDICTMLMELRDE